MASTHSRIRTSKLRCAEEDLLLEIVALSLGDDPDDDALGIMSD